MINKISSAELAQFITMGTSELNSGKLLDYDSAGKCYIMESEYTRKEWRLALAKTRFSEFSRGVSELITLKKEANQNV